MVTLNYLFSLYLGWLISYDTRWCLSFPSLLKVKDEIFLCDSASSAREDLLPLARFARGTETQREQTFFWSTERINIFLCDSDEWIDIYNNDGMPTPPATAGKKYSGKFHLRIGSELHQALAIRAMQKGNSLNNFCVQLLKKSISQPDQLP